MMYDNINYRVVLLRKHFILKKFCFYFHSTLGNKQAIRELDGGKLILFTYYLYILHNTLYFYNIHLIFLRYSNITFLHLLEYIQSVMQSENVGCESMRGVATQQ